ncbi:hypothetical protein N7449_001267 [Penicillium cf. viridicatum]|uniref:Clr5 domain-containing protein n=1 Tax=Penicillium cf. viridicatum TaxID=2972119 RepID=A0A9W9T935_9EURO|nr:hypothetical protein N7449_001267 [Penicillium cf. viridicatum]
MANLDWEAHKAEVERLYIHEDKSLKEVIQTMGAVHGFCKSKSQYETQFAKWGLKKYHMGSKKWKLLNQSLKKEAQTKRSMSKEFSLNQRESSARLGGRPFRQQWRKKSRRLLQVSPFNNR